MLIKGLDKSKLFFTSDTHFFHSNIIKFCNRPFDEDLMDEDLIKLWNDVVPKDSDVFHAGDFAFTGDIDRLKSIVSKLNGRIYLALGNHDYQNKYNRETVLNIFHKTSDMFYVPIEDKDLSRNINFQICHYPLLYWRRGYLMLHGHVHSGPASSGNEIVPYHHMRYDIGVDNNDYVPISYTQLLTKLNIITTKQ